MKDPKDVFYNDVSPEVAEPWISQLKPQSAVSFASAVDSVAWNSGFMPCTYVKAEKDQGVYFWLQEKMLDGVSEKSGQPWKIVNTDSGHSAWLTQIPTIVQLIEAAAGA